MKLVNKILLSNIFLPIAAVLLTIATQIQLGNKPQWQPYLLLIFLATIFEYNRHRITDIITSSEEFILEKNQCLFRKSKVLLSLIAIWAMVFIITIFHTKTKVLIALVPLGIATILYSVPIIGNKNVLFRLREIPYLKIFLIAFVWSMSTILPPVIHADKSIFNSQVDILFAERFFFIFSIAIPFDIRDLKEDENYGLKTIPMLISRNNAMLISYFSLSLCLVISLYDFHIQNNWAVLIAINISLIITTIILKSKFFKDWGKKYYQLLDGTLILQGGLILAFYFLY